MKIRDWLNQVPGGRSLIIAVPYFWMFLFFFIPFISVLKISFSTTILSIPPFSDLIQWTEEALNLKIHF